MTINKRHGQSLSNVGLYLSKHVFKECQLYIEISRGTRKKRLQILIYGEDDQMHHSTINMVYIENFKLF